MYPMKSVSKTNTSTQKTFPTFVLFGLMTPANAHIKAAAFVIMMNVRRSSVIDEVILL